MTLTVQSPTGGVVFQAPVTVGSDNDPLPVGEWKVNSVSVNPPFNYNPALFWDADPSHAKARIAPGPNNPVGVRGSISARNTTAFTAHPSRHASGTPNRTDAFGLTNWDVMRLVHIRGAGNARSFFDEASSTSTVSRRGARSVAEPGRHPGAVVGGCASCLAGIRARSHVVIEVGCLLRPSSVIRRHLRTWRLPRLLRRHAAREVDEGDVAVLLNKQLQVPGRECLRAL